MIWDFMNVTMRFLIMAGGISLVLFALMFIWLCIIWAVRSAFE